MTDIDEVVEGIALAYGYDPVKAREYYLRTRKLKGRLVKKAKGIDNPFKTKTIDRSKPARLVSVNGVPVGQKNARQERLEIQQQKINAARARAKKLSPKKRNAVEKKLDSLEKKLNKVRNIKNPFGNAKLKRVPAKPFNPSRPKNPFGGATLSRK